MVLCLLKTIINVKNKRMKKIKFSLVAFSLLLTMSSCNDESDRSAVSNPVEQVESQSEAPDMHTSQNALDWEGTYKGTLPCADCEGIETTLVLKKDHTFERTAVYKGKESHQIDDSGKFSWDNEGRVVRLEIKDENPSYKVKEGSLVLLDREGKENTGELAEFYVLKKQ